jgi:hypothetical protein
MKDSCGGLVREGRLPGRCFGVEWGSVLINGALSGEHPEFITKRCGLKGRVEPRPTGRAMFSRSLSHYEL